MTLASSATMRRCGNGTGGGTKADATATRMIIAVRIAERVDIVTEPDLRASRVMIDVILKGSKHDGELQRRIVGTLLAMARLARAALVAAVSRLVAGVRGASKSLTMNEERPPCDLPAYCARDPTKWASVLRLEAQGEAGLLDRASSLVHAANVAASVCARLDHGSPSALLSAARHNYGAPVAGDDWGKYVRLTWTSGAPVFGASPAAAATARNLTSTSPDGVARDYGEAKRLAAAGAAVDWTIRVKYHAFKGALEAAVDDAPRRRDRFVVRGGAPADRCTFARSAPSALAEDAAGRFLAAAGLARGAYGALHVRRGDELRRPKAMRDRGQVACDTAPPTLAASAACRFPGRGALVAFTDERDAGYLGDLAFSLRAAGFGPVVLGDAAIRDQLAPGDRVDNFLTFAAADVAMARARAAVHVGRGHCAPPCPPPR